MLLTCKLSKKQMIYNTGLLKQRDSLAIRSMPIKKNVKIAVNGPELIQIQISYRADMRPGSTNLTLADASTD